MSLFVHGDSNVPAGVQKFPLFRNKFLGGALLTNNLSLAEGDHAQQSIGGGMETEPVPPQPSASPIAVYSLLGESSDSLPSPSALRPSAASVVRRPTLNSLDLGALPREDGPPSETQLRRQKFQFYERKCSEIAEGLYLSGEVVARSKELLDANGITHVVNCVGMICKEWFKDQGITYRTYYLNDTPSEDILSVLYDALEFIDTALREGGRVLVHCSQGVSRSATLVIAFLMWRSGLSYDEVYAKVKEARGVTNPNIGFTCQLLQWQKRRQPQAPSKIRMYRIAPHSKLSPGTLVAKSISPPRSYPNNTYRELDQRGAFIIQAPYRIYTWVGSRCPPAMAAAARYHARLLLKFEGHEDVLKRIHSSSLEGKPTEPVVLEAYEGLEPAELASMIDPPLLDPEAARIHARRSSIAEELASGSTAAPRPTSGALLISARTPLVAGEQEEYMPAVEEGNQEEGGGGGEMDVSGAGAEEGGGGGGRGETEDMEEEKEEGFDGNRSFVMTQATHDDEEEEEEEAGPGWVIGEVEAYHQDYQLYLDAVRATEAAAAAAVAGGGDTNNSSQHQLGAGGGGNMAPGFLRTCRSTNGGGMANVLNVAFMIDSVSGGAEHTGLSESFLGGRGGAGPSGSGGMMSRGGMRGAATAAHKKYRRSETQEGTSGSGGSCLLLNHELSSHSSFKGRHSIAGEGGLGGFVWPSVIGEEGEGYEYK